MIDHLNNVEILIAIINLIGFLYTGKMKAEMKSEIVKLKLDLHEFISKEFVSKDVYYSRRVSDHQPDGN